MIDLEKRITAKNFSLDSFIQVPRVLRFGKYRALNNDDRMLYGELFSKLNISQVNGWVNAQGEYYVKVKRTTMEYMLGLSPVTLRKCYKRLEEIGLIDVNRIGQRNIDEVYPKLPVRVELTAEEIEKSDERLD